MAAGIRKAGESLKAYRARLVGEQKAMDRAAQGRVIFSSSVELSYLSFPQSRTARAVRDGKLNHKSGRRLATAYV